MQFHIHFINDMNTKYRIVLFYWYIWYCNKHVITRITTQNNWYAHSKLAPFGGRALGFISCRLIFWNRLLHAYVVSQCSGHLVRPTAAYKLSLSSCVKALVVTLCTTICKLMFYVMTPFVHNAQFSFCNVSVCNMTHQWPPNHLGNTKPS